jgi:multiple sugar transport system permease protein
MVLRFRRRKPATLASREARLGYVLVLPAIIIVLLLVIFPLLWNVSLSFRSIRLIELSTVDFLDFSSVSLDNFRRVIGVRDFWPTVWTTLLYAFLGTAGSLLIALWAALVVKKAFLGRSMVRGLMLFPYVVPVVAAALVWRLMLHPTFGVVNEWIVSAGGTRTDFLNSRSAELSLLGFDLTVPLALSTVIIFEWWRYFPFAFLFILARLQAIPGVYDEAAQVDGATPTQRFWYITLPQLWGVLSILFVLRFIFTFNKFDDIYLLNGGAAGTQVITIKIVEWLRGRGDIGSAAALAIVLAAILLVLLAFYFKFIHRDEEAE